MGKSRLEAFSDGVLAIIITIMVLELKVPHGAALPDLLPVLPVFLSYLVSFVYVGIYWNNHHHLLHTAQRITGGVLWANLHLLFWLSLVPFVTGWAGENHFAAAPTALYGVVLFMCGIGYWVLAQAIMRADGAQSVLRKAVGKDPKAVASLVAYTLAVGVAYFQPWIAVALYVGVALMWLIPDRRIERVVNAEGPHAEGSHH